MASLYNKIHEENLHKIRDFDVKTVKKLAELAVESITKGPESFDKFDLQTLDATRARENVDGLAFLFLECCKADVSSEKLIEFLETSSLNSERIFAITDVYSNSKHEIDDLYVESDNLLYYHDMQWRFEAKIGSRSLLNQMVPLVCMDLKLGDSPNAAETTKLSHAVLQTDPTALIRMADSLEKALNSTRSRNIRKIEKQIVKLTLDK